MDLLLTFARVDFFHFFSGNEASRKQAFLHRSYLFGVFPAYFFYPLFKILVDFWLEYWKNENQLITYLLTEHIFYIIYRENEDIKRELDNADSFYYPIDYFQKKLNSPYSYNIFKEIFDKEKYLKLSYKYELYDKINDKKTFYGKLKELYNVKD